MKQPIHFRLASFLGHIALWSLMLCAGVSSRVAAQGLAQVYITGVASPLQTPFIGDLQQDFALGRYSVQFVYTHPSRQAARFRFKLTVEQNGAVLATTTTEPVSFAPGIYTYQSFRTEPAIPFESLGALIARLPDRIRNHLYRTGTLPEGDYTIMLEPIQADPNAFILTKPAVVSFSVAFPDPPIVLAPENRTGVLQRNPIFTWLPVVAPLQANIEYRLLIIEMLPGQTIRDAFRANPVQLETDWMPGTSFVYTDDLLPLKSGKRYVWNVKARATNRLPIRENGHSEIRTFIYGSPYGSLALAGPLWIEQDFAQVTDLDFVNIKEDFFAYTLNGRATLMLEVKDDFPLEISVQLKDVRILKGNLLQPTLLSGSISADVSKIRFPTQWMRRIIRPQKLIWMFGKPIQIEGTVIVAGQVKPEPVRMNLNADGFSEIQP